ncbi:MAG: methyltransferase domain-containing protein [Candidatus Lindowbacteria bacterium]|nr:methyltransferase domain-containing protein [Candidatus Lindowbacteria bacterium]
MPDSPSYNKVTDYYEKHWADASDKADAQKRLEIDEDALTALLPLQNTRVLEIGAGTGNQTEAFVQHGARVVAIDLALSSLIRIRNRLGKSCFVVCADAHALPFRASCFDRGALFSVLMFLNPHRSFSELKRVLRPQFKAVVVEPLADNIFLSIYRTVTSKYSGLAHWLSLDTLKASIKAHFSGSTVQAYYLFPFVNTMSPGAARNVVINIEKKIFDMFPGLSNYAWIAMVRMEENAQKESN